MQIEDHLLHDNYPSQYLEKIYDHPLFRQDPFRMLRKLRKIEQSPKYHPEGNVWNHTMLVVDEAAKRKDQSKNPKVFMWAALLHDIGKGTTTKSRKGKITSYEHDKAGAKLTEVFLSQFPVDGEEIQAVCGLVRYHMHILYVVNNLKFANIERMMQNTDIHEIALLGLCDRLGRSNSDQRKEEEHIRQFLKVCGMKKDIEKGVK